MRCTAVGRDTDSNRTAAPRTGKFALFVENNVYKTAGKGVGAAPNSGLVSELTMKACCLLFLLLCGCATLNYAKSDHCDGTHFFNTDPDARDLQGLMAVLKWRMTSDVTPWTRDLTPVPPAGVDAPVPPGAARITMVNHATLLVELHGFTYLTDPVYAERASPVSFAGPKRYRAAGIALTDLPHIDAVVISHNHYDHLDIATLQALWQRDKPPMIVPLGTAALLKDAGISEVTELDWWQSTSVGPGAKVTLTEAQHWSARGVFDRNKALWGGYVVGLAGVQVYFAGDTGYGGHFQRILSRFGPMDVALLPIGAYEPRWFMKTQHMNPDDAVRAHLDLQARQSMGVHFGTFQLTDEGIDAPIRELGVALQAHGVDAKRFITPANGQSLTVGIGGVGG